MKKKILTVALVVALVAIIAVGSLAYFSDKDENKNVASIGNVDIVLDEAPVTYDAATYKWTADQSAARVKANTYNNLYPGAVAPKDPTVHNEGSIDAYVRAKVTVTNYSNWVFQMGGKMNATGHPEYLNLLVGDLGEGWEIVKTENVKGDMVYTIEYKQILKAGESTPAIFEKLQVPADFAKRSAGDSQKQVDMAMGDGHKFEVKVEAQAIQAPGFENAEAAWASYNNSTKPYGK